MIATGLKSAEEVTVDVVVIWPAKEHVPDSTSFLKTVRERLRWGGLLMLRTLNVRTAPARRNGWVWQWIGPKGTPMYASRSCPRRDIFCFLSDREIDGVRRVGPAPVFGRATEGLARRIITS